MEGDSDSSQNDNHGYDNNQNIITITIIKRQEVCRTEIGVIKINFAKSQQVVCEKCSISLKSMKYLEKHMRDMHSNQETCYYCSECGILKATRKQLHNHQRSHKTSVCPSCGKVLPLWNKHKHVNMYLYVLRQKIRLDRTYYFRHKKLGSECVYFRLHFFKF